MVRFLPVTIDESTIVKKPKNINMVDDSSVYWDGGVNGAPDDRFNNILNILDFPMESVEGDNLIEEDWDAKFQALGPISEALQGISPVSQLNVDNVTGFRPNISVTSGPTSEMKQMASIEEIYSTKISLDSSNRKGSSSFKIQSPNSVLENNSSCSAEKGLSTSPELLIPVRTRSRRPRPKTFSSWRLIPPITPSEYIFDKNVKDKKKKKLSHLSGVSETEENSFDQSIPTKRCTHCQVSKTPQWREGPMGPKTLCNACGVRYRSGRLFPEYRPAVSPTFIPSRHSNSHKKVIEMRNKSILGSSMPEMDPAMSPPPEFVPMSAHLFDRI